MSTNRELGWKIGYLILLAGAIIAMMILFTALKPIVCVFITATPGR